ncbi:Defensin 1 [Olea europaea subsp. europaea]|uniref:Defensin 1 n=1 Tax=Olea europaea subsp. europaea TaxID=158383 RepID=A0A8S0U4I6_OLEEU|nr:Defensin 1 [Olea europaea subsp. europaea]
MVKLLNSNKTTFLSLFFCFLILAAFEAQIGEAKCTRPSKGYRSRCVGYRCNSYCMQSEGAYSGSCMMQNSGGFACYCHYYRC